MIGPVGRAAAKLLRKVTHSKQTDSTEEIRTRATKVYRALGKHTASLRRRIDDQGATYGREEYDRLQSILAAIDANDTELLHEYGLDLSYAWVDDVVSTMVRANLAVEIATLGLQPTTQLDATTGHSVFNPTMLQPEDLAGIELGILFKQIYPVASTVRANIDIFDYHDAATGRALTEHERTLYRLAVDNMLAARGIITDSDVPGKDYLIHFESSLSAKVDVLLDRLRHSAGGKLIVTEEGNTYFKPSEEFIELLGLRSRARRQEFATHGILLKDTSGHPTPHCLMASSFVDPLNVHIMHVFFYDTKKSAKQDKTYALVRAMGVVRSERFHDIFFDSNKLSPDLVAYAVGKVFQDAAQKILRSAEKYNDWSEFDIVEYVGRNYDNNGVILPEDKAIIMHVVQVLKQLGLAPQSIGHAADIGAGPNLYPAMLLSPYMLPNAKLDLLEFSPNRTYLTDLIKGKVNAKLADIWGKFEELMVKSGGKLYEGCEAKAKAAANVQFGDIFTLPKDTYDLISSYFVAESIVDSQMPFRAAIQSIANALKPSGIMVIAHMVGSEGWPAGVGTHFPAVSLTVSQIKQAYLDAGLDIISIAPVGQDANQKARDGYHGMVVVVAQPRYNRSLFEL